MTIQINSAIGSGPTELAAFDDALIHTGIANFNLLLLSSVIPPHTELVHEQKPQLEDSTWGDRLYVVMAQERTATVGESVWAGIGWVQDPTDDRGLFVEHHGHSKEAVEKDIRDSLAALITGRPGHNFSEMQMKIVGETCTDQPICAMVCAVYKSENW